MVEPLQTLDGQLDQPVGRLAIPSGDETNPARVVFERWVEKR
jgi:hypothetical protein